MRTWVGLFAVLVVAGCGSNDPVAVPTPAEFVGTWKTRDMENRLVLTGDGQFQWTQGEWTNTGLVTGWPAEGFEISAYPKTELHLVTEKPNEVGGYTWMTVDEVRYWRASKEARIGALIPREKDEPEPPAEDGAAPAPATPAPAPAAPVAPEGEAPVAPAPAGG